MSDDTSLTAFLWPIVCEIVKTAIENKQNLVVEGCYIPFDWSSDFEPEYIHDIKYYCLVMSERYIREHFSDIKKYGNIIEKRMNDEWCTMENVIEDNKRVLELARSHRVNYILIDDRYEISLDGLMPS